MALISYYNQPTGSNSIDIENSPYNKAHTVELKVTTCKEDELYMNAFLSGKTIVKGIIDEIPEISYSTTWGDSPAAVLNEKIKKFTQHKWMKMFAVQRGGYKPPLVTDGWTQQFPKSAEPLNISFKFRAYPIDNYYNTSAFSDIIRLLIFVTTPQEFELSKAVTSQAQAIYQAYDKGEKFAGIVKGLKNSLEDENISFKDFADALENNTNANTSAGAKNLIKRRDELFKFIEDLGDMKDDDTGGCPLIQLGINGLIKPSSTVKWLLKSWSFKPSLNTTYNNNPIYVDFNVSLQTQYILTDTDLTQILY